MKKRTIYLLGAVIVVLTVIALTGTLAAEPKQGGAIVKNEVILDSGPDRHIQLRHIVLKGTNEEIGKALADIAREDYNTSLVKYASPLYAKARLDYMGLNYPIMLERMKGVAASYGLSLDDTDYDTSCLNYFLAGPQCSAIFIPAQLSSNGNSFFACNRDYYTASWSEIMGKERKGGEIDFSSRIFVIELYPDQGYSSITIGVGDLLNVTADAVNSKGLSIVGLEDDTYGMDRTVKDLSRLSGLQLNQAMRLIIDRCATLDEAKEVLLNNKISLTFMPGHFMVMDSSGRSFIYERSSKDFGDRFIDNDGTKPILMTNHSNYEYPAPDKFPEPSKDDYDTFNRYRRLQKYVDNHAGKYSMDDGRQAMSLVFGRVEEASEGGYHPLPLRTLYTATVDTDSRTMRMRVYERDGKIDPATGMPELIFSEPFEFKLKE